MKVHQGHRSAVSLFSPASGGLLCPRRRSEPVPVSELWINSSLLSLRTSLFHFCWLWWKVSILWETASLLRMMMMMMVVQIKTHTGDPAWFVLLSQWTCTWNTTNVLFTMNKRVLPTYYFTLLTANTVFTEKWRHCEIRTWTSTATGTHPAFSDCISRIEALQLKRGGSVPLYVHSWVV